MIEKKVIVIKDGMTDEEIFKTLNDNPAPLVADLRTQVDKTIEQIVREQYGKDYTAAIPEGNHRPNVIEITTD